MLGWLTFGFAGVYASVLILPGLLLGSLAIAYRPWRPPRQAMPALHIWLGVILGASLLQMVPLPSPLVDRLSPWARGAWTRLSLSTPATIPLSIDLNASARALCIMTGAVLMFLIARRVFATGGVRIVVRGIAMTGLLLSAIALAQETTAHGYVYWRWKLVVDAAPAFGPFINRNQFATWAILAIPLAAGYLVAHIEAHAPRGDRVISWRRRAVTLVDGRAASLAAAILLLFIALVATLSRSGLAGLGAAGATGALLRARRGKPGMIPLKWGLAALAAAALAVGMIGTGVIAGRLLSIDVAAAGRLQIWHDTLPIVVHFWLTGTGVGTFETAMLLYQRSSPGVVFNQAHNHYLQVAAEGGLLVGIPVAAALGRFFQDARQALAHDRSGMYWVRAAAFCGIVGVAVQSLWETGLTIPANAALAALVAAIVIHEPVVHAPRF